MENRAIYQPKGAAREYSRWACNLYNGCSNRCDYCYCRRGILAHTLGVDEPVLKKSVGRTSKDAFETFSKELALYGRYIVRDGTGLFFSFSTDPMLPHELPLTVKCVGECVDKDVPVQILTKESYWVFGVNDFIDNLFTKWYDRNIRIGFTLTGHDELEPGADSNNSRMVACLYLMHNGVDTFISLEPVVDFKSSLSVIRTFIDDYKTCPPEFRIGLMSGVDKEKYYNREECGAFISEVKKLAAENDFAVKWKDSIVKYYKKSV